MPFFVRSRRAGVATQQGWERDLAADYGAVRVLDLTSQGAEPWVRFSPFYPHGGISVPFSRGAVTQSVKGIWQGLKVFEGEDVDPSRLEIASMRGIKRSVRSH